MAVRLTKTEKELEAIYYRGCQGLCGETHREEMENNEFSGYV